MKRQIHSKLTLLAGLAWACFTSGQAGAALNIADQPLVVFQNVKSNLIVVMDDSGSMSFETVVPTNDGALYWQAGTTDSFVQNDGSLFFGTAGRKTAYVFPYVEGPYNNHDRVPPFAQFAFMRSSTYNSAYYDPEQTFLPWPDFDSYTFDNIDPTAAPSDPSGSTTNSGREFDLTDDFEFASGDSRFHFNDGMVIPAGTRYHNGTSWVTTPVDLAWTGGNGSQRGVDFYPAVYYTPTDTGTFTITVPLPGPDLTVPGDCSTPVPATYKAFERAPSALSVLSGDVDALGPDGTCLIRTEIAAGTPEMQNFANWFSYYRKRHLSVRNGVMSAFKTLQLGMNVGYFSINNRNSVTMREFDKNPAVDERNDFLEDVLTESFGGGTPNRQALNHAGAQFQRTTNPIVEFECQKNFSVMFTDGFSSLSGIPSPGNVDGSEGSPYADGISNSIADIAMQYYEDLDLSGITIPPQNEGDVAIPRACETATPPTPLDCKTDPHMNTYMVVLNGRGNIFGVTHNEIEDSYTNPPAWPNVNGDRDPSQIDDLYHAAVNGRGLMLNAATPTEIADRFATALNDIVSRSRPTTSLTATSTRLTTESRLYQAGFDSFDWSGDLLSVTLDGTVEWSANTELVERTTSRKVFTYDGDGGAEFTANKLDDTTEQALKDNILSVLGVDVDAASPAFSTQGFVDYVLGDDALEGNPLRARESLIGDIVNSEPSVSGPGNQGWSRLAAGAGGGATYLNYVDGPKQSRPLTVLVGANDGLFHAFAADDGEELFAYAPQTVIPDLPELGNPNYLHRYYVDATATIADAYAGSWKTVVVAGLGAGGRGVFALDVTSPGSFNSDDVLWEINADDDPDIGFTIGRPVVSRAADGTWIAIFGNGYNSQNNDGVLFVVDLFTGAILAKIPTGVGDDANPAGLASPRVEMNGVDGLTVANAYSGDLRGNLWKFDLSDNTPANWDSAFSAAGNPLPLFVAQDRNGNPQPITAAPTLARTPQGDLAIYFGTGKFFEVSDATVGTTPALRTFYAVLENRPDLDPLADFNILASNTRSSLNDIRILSEINDNGFTVRRVDLDTVPGELGDGYFIDLAVDVNDPTGERVVATPRVDFGALIFTTFEPTNTPCVPGGVPRLYVLDAVTGGPKLSSNSLDCTDCIGLELTTGAPLVPPVVIDKTGEERVQGCYDDPSAPGCFCILNPNDESCSGVEPDEIISACELGSRPVVVIDPVTRDRIPIGCIKEGRTVWSEQVDY